MDGDEAGGATRAFRSRKTKIKISPDSSRCGAARRNTMHPVAVVSRSGHFNKKDDERVHASEISKERSLPVRPRPDPIRVCTVANTINNLTSSCSAGLSAGWFALSSAGPFHSPIISIMNEVFFSAHLSHSSCQTFIKIEKRLLSKAAIPFIYSNSDRGLISDS